MTTEWVPQACTLPTAERPLRVAEFDGLFASAVRGVDRVAGGLRLALTPTPEVAATVAGLAARETGCCSFFTFTLTATAGALELGIAVTDGHDDVLDALAARVGT
ncbi:MAG: hypothetical protein GEV28_23945 [Actinophytocola sp.]|uniref:hypothetical protein n=1 Tax=Actinophytocola sp. TaxID=1872138 RepID=UPI0013265091|nr:hypothetical protein [Actinophytocola sp.]MPZ83278.1 hypothetical protein [Actinophytocola sp.]